MRVVITDSSCLIDLKKGNLLRAMLSLPFDFAIPQPLMANELLSLTEDDKAEMIEAGLEVAVLSGTQVKRVSEYHAENRRPSFNDYFALVLAEDTEESILLTGDGALREIAEGKALEAHGVLWLLDQLYENECVTVELLIQVIHQYLDDPDVWLPDAELRARARRFQR